MPVLGAASLNLVRLRNDPSNICQYHLFRSFVEALALNDVSVSVGDDGNLNFSVVRGTSLAQLFATDGTGLTFRSPTEMVRFLGEVVRESSGHAGERQPCLTSRSGECLPIFIAKTGRKDRDTEVAAKVGGVEYWVPPRRLGKGEADFSHPALIIVKTS